MRYARLWLQFLKMSWMADMEYRMNFVVRIFGEIVWYAAQLSVFEVLFLHTNTLNGWDVHAMRVFMASLFIADVIYMILFHENMESFSGLVRRGELDLYLVKPINSQFMVSCRKLATANVINLIMTIGYLLWALRGLSHPIGVAQALNYVLLMASGLTVSYSLRFLFSIPTLYFQEASNVQFIWYQLYRLATRPDILYPSLLRYLVLTILPVAFIASVPSKILVEGANVSWLAAGFAIAATFMFLTAFCWRRALRHYASASS